MFKGLGRLAAVFGSRRAKVAGAAASCLTFAIILSGCSVILEPGKGSRLLEALLRLIKFLPEGPVVALEEFVLELLGDSFAQKFNEIMAAITQKPNLTTSVWGNIFNGLAVVMFGLMLFYAYFYLRDYSRAVDKHGAEAVNEGRGGVIPIFQYTGRFAVVAFSRVANVAEYCVAELSRESLTRKP